jgi:hypothetical protein
MPIKTINNPLFQAVTSTGAPLSGGKLYTYKAGTSTEKESFSDIELSTSHTNPIILDSLGQAKIYGHGAYKFNLTTSADVQVTGWPVDNITTSQGGDTAARVAIGDYGDYLATAITTIGSTETTLVIDKEITLTEDATIPSTLALEFTRGGSLTGAYTVTINGPIIAGLWQIFDSTVTVDRSTGVGQEAYADWYGTLAKTLSSGETDILFTTSETIAATEEITVDRDSLSVRSVNGAFITYTGSGDAVTIAGEGIYWDVRLKKGIAWADGTDTTSVGLVVSAPTQYSNLKLFVEGFNIGVKLYGDGDGVVHNYITIQRLYNNRIQLQLARNDSGWVNSNYVHNGNITYASGIIVTAVANSIVMKWVEIAHESENCNEFEAISFQGAFAGAAPAATTLIENNGQYNRFLHCRVEISEGTANLTQYILYGANSLYNIFDAGRIPTDATTAEFVSDAGTGNKLLNFNRTSNHGENHRLSMNSLKLRGNPTSQWVGDDDYGGLIDAENQYSADGYNFFNRVLGGDQTGGMTGQGQMLIGTNEANRDDSSGNYVAMLQIKEHGRYGTWGNSDVRMTAGHASTDDAGYSTLWYIEVPDGHVLRVKADIVSRKLGNSVLASFTLCGLYDRTGGTLSLADSNNSAVAAGTDPSILESGSFDFTDCQLEADDTNKRAVIKVGGNEAATYYFAAKVEWQFIYTSS